MLQPKIVNVEALPGYKLQLSYINGEKKLFDARPISVEIGLGGCWMRHTSKPCMYSLTAQALNGLMGKILLRMNCMKRARRYKEKIPADFVWNEN